MLRFITVLIIVCLFQMAPAVNLTVDHTALPYPMHQRWLPEGNNVGAGLTPGGFELEFFISPDGCTDSVTFVGGDSKDISPSLWGALQGMDFEPARYEGDSIAYILPAVLEIKKRNGQPRINLEFPYNPHLKAKNKKLIIKTLRRNGYAPAVMEYLPGYFCTPPVSLAPGEVPYAVYKITLDSTGFIENVETVASNAPGCAGMMSSVMLYGVFLPAERNHRPVPSDTYVTVRNFPNLGKSLKEWPPLYPGQPDYFLNYLRVEALPYLDSGVVYPIPMNLSAGGVVTVDTLKFIDTLETDLFVNTRGRAIITDAPTRLNSERLNALREIVARIEFLPYQTIAGGAALFRGKARLMSYYSKKIRIHLDWLPDRPQETIYKDLPDNNLKDKEKSP